jgi:carotenoid cleavage dioxygenase-like enzyme
VQQLHPLHRGWPARGLIQGACSPPALAALRSDAFFCFHTINAWEAGGALHIDLCAYEDGLAWHETFKLPHLRSGEARLPRANIRRCGCAGGDTASCAQSSCQCRPPPPPTPAPTQRRYTLPNLEAAIAAGPASVHAASMEVVAGAGATPGGAHLHELPRISKACAMQPYRYVYAAVAARDSSPFLDAVAKARARAARAAASLGGWVVGWGRCVHRGWPLLAGPFPAPLRCQIWLTARPSPHRRWM